MRAGGWSGTWPMLYATAGPRHRHPGSLAALPGPGVWLAALPGQGLSLSRTPHLNKQQHHSVNGMLNHRPVDL